MIIDIEVSMVMIKTLNAVDEACNTGMGYFLGKIAIENKEKKMQTSIKMCLPRCVSLPRSKIRASTYIYVKHSLTTTDTEKGYDQLLTLKISFHDQLCITITKSAHMGC